MKSSLLASLPLALLVGLGVACGSPPVVPPLPPPPVAPPVVSAAAPLETPDAPFRQQPPAKGPSRPFAAPRVQTFTLKNGIRVLFVARSHPGVSVSVVVKAGQGDVKGARPGALSFMGAMLEQGTRGRSALKLSDDFEAIGAHHDASFGWDSGALSMEVLRDNLGKGLELLADVAQNPTFPKPEVERLRARRLASLQMEKNNPSAMMFNTQAAALFGRGHPYGHSLGGGIEDVRKLTAAELVKLHREVFSPSLVSIVASGGISNQVLLPLLEQYFGAWKAPARARGTVPPVAAPRSREEPRLLLVDKPGAAQSQIALTQVGVPASVADRDAISVMNAILGGMFSSHINLNLREKHAYTYGARSHFSMRLGPGPFAASAAVVSDKTAPAIHELFVELEGMREKEVTEAELQGAKDSLIDTLPARFETARDVVSALADLVVYDWPLDEFETRPARLAKVTVADVKRVAKQYLSPRTMKVVVVGDKAKLEGDLSTLHLGAADLRDPYGDRVGEAPASAPPAPPKKK